MNRIALIAIAQAFVLAPMLGMLGCGERPGLRACESDAQCPVSAACVEGSCQDIVTVSFVQPAPAAAPVVTNGLLLVEARVLGGTPERVELLRDGATLSELSPPYQHTWNTAGESEGPHTLILRATVGGREYASEPRAVLVDRTPPAVLSLVPAHGESNVWFRDPIRLELSEALADLPPDGVQLLAAGGTVLGATASLSSDRKAITLAPAAWPGVPSNLRVALAGLSDLAGNAVALPASGWSFTLPAWQQPASASPLNVKPGDSAQGPAVAVDAGGRAIVVWAEGPARQTKVYARRLERGAWVPLGDSLNLDASREAKAPALLIDADGNPIVAWLEVALGPFQVYVKRWTGTAWTSLTASLNVNAQNAASAVALALDPSSKQPVVAWTEGQPALTYVKRWDGAKWSQVGGSLNGSAAQQTREPSIAVGADGAPVVAFVEEQASNAIGQLFVKRWDEAEKAWVTQGTGSVNANQSRSAFAPVLRTLGTELLVAWLEDGATTRAVQARRYAGEWFGLGIYTSPGSTGANALSVWLEASASGRHVLSWVESGAPTSVRVAQWDGERWQVLPGSGTSPLTGATTARVALDATDVPSLVWVTEAGQLQLRRFNR